MKWITALDLDQWADTLPARVDFPGMVGDLIRATVANISDFRFPNGDKGQVRGFDGVLDAESNCFLVPDGESVWEFGVTEGGAAKANGDYTKRTLGLDAGVRRRTTFVFVSPRTWDSSTGKKREDWVEEKRALNDWKDVLYIDGLMLEDWLADRPAVAARYAKHHLKKMPLVGAQSSVDFWEEFSTRFAPELADKVLLAGRKDQAKQLVRELSAGPGRGSGIRHRGNPERRSGGEIVHRGKDARGRLRRRGAPARPQEGARFPSPEPGAQPGGPADAERTHRGECWRRRATSRPREAESPEQHPIGGCVHSHDLHAAGRLRPCEEVRP
jgi:hypothetical protein